MSRYGLDYNGEPRGCPSAMYPWDVDFDGDTFVTLEDLQDAVYHDSLNLPISWYFNPADEGGEFVLVFVMPRKYGKTWSMKLTPGFDRSAVEDWLESWTREVAARHYGWMVGQ